MSIILSPYNLYNIQIVESFRPFIITINTNNNGTTNNNQFQIQTTGGGYDYEVNWGDGNISTNVTGNIIHTYSNSGIYDVAISGSFPHIFYNSTGDNRKLIDIKQWGDIMWSSMDRAFDGCIFLEGTFTDTPNLTNVTNMIRTFRDARAFNSDISNWDVSNVTNMNRTFSAARRFNQDISNWNVSNVTDMNNMFWEAFAFNQDLSTWCVTNVPDPPPSFDTNATSWVLPRPIWGTCPS